MSGDTLISGEMTSGDLTRRRRGLSAWIASSLWSHSNPDFWTSQSCFLSSNWFFNASIHLLIKLLGITEPAVPSAWLLGLDWKLYPSKKQHSIHAAFLEGMQYWSSKRQKGSAGRLKLSFKASRIHFPPSSELSASANYCNYSNLNRKHLSTANFYNIIDFSWFKGDETLNT